MSLWTGSRTGESAADAVVGAMTLLLGGYLVIQLFEHTIAPHFHFGPETHPESFMRPSAAYTAVGGLWIHTFFDGVSIAAAFLVNFRVGLLVFIAILLHKMPEVHCGFICGLGLSRKALWLLVSIGSATCGCDRVAGLQPRSSALRTPCPLRGSPLRFCQRIDS